MGIKIHIASIHYKIILKIKKDFISNPKVWLLTLTTSIALVYFSWGINSWKFSFVGDEWALYAFAKGLSEQNLFINPLSFKGVYLHHSILISQYQAFFLKILGNSNFSWKISSTILIIPITIVFFLWLRKSFNMHIAFFSTLILQSSFYLANFFKTGYPQALCFTLFILCLYIAKSCSDNPTAKNFILLGLILGISFYVYIGPLFPFLIWPYLLPLLAKKHLRKELLLKFFLLGFSYVIILSPAFIDNTSLKGPAANTSFFKREFSNNFQMVVNVFHNFLLFYKNYDYLYNHFVAGPYLDVVSRILAFIGTIIVILKIRKKEYLFLLLTYISTCVIIGLTSPYWYTPTSRGLFFLPFGFAFAGIALARITKMFSWKIALFIIPIIFITNVYQSQIGVFKEAGYTGTALIVKSLQDAKENNSERKIDLILSNSSGYSYHNIYTMQQAYGLESIKFEVIRSSQLQCYLLKDADVLIFNNDPEAKNAIVNITCPLNYNFSKRILTPGIYL